MSDDRIVKILEKNRKEEVRIAQSEWSPPDHPDKLIRFVDIRIFGVEDGKGTSKGIRLPARMTGALIGALQDALDWSPFDFEQHKKAEAPAAKPAGKADRMSENPDTGSAKPAPEQSAGEKDPLEDAHHDDKPKADPWGMVQKDKGPADDGGVPF